ncbi:hypothetical protein SRDD_22580 [Serratia sp. DD3]|nr:hypothetical protein SRDD_22580 [Serratia sp. DD3]
MSKASFIRVWFLFATIYTCITMGHQIGNFFNGSQWPWLISSVIMIAIGWSTSSKLKELK